MTLAQPGFEPAQRRHICSSARRSNHSATGQGQERYMYMCHNIVYIADVLSPVSSHNGLSLLCMLLVRETALTLAIKKKQGQWQMLIFLFV